MYTLVISLLTAPVIAAPPIPQVELGPIYADAQGPQGELADPRLYLDEHLWIVFNKLQELDKGTPNEQHIANSTRRRLIALGNAPGDRAPWWRWSWAVLMLAALAVLVLLIAQQIGRAAARPTPQPRITAGERPRAA